MTTKARKTSRLEKLAERISVCTKCPLHKSRKIAVPGDGRPSAKAMIIGEAPGRDEDASGHPFVGASGRFLGQMLEGPGLDRDKFFITNVVKCRPLENRAPTQREVETCTSHYLVEQIKLVKPKLIMILGGVAAKRLLGVKRVDEARGQVFERDGCKYLVGYHPSVRRYGHKPRRKIAEDFDFLKRQLGKC